jgi:hypothetical protein
MKLEIQRESVGATYMESTPSSLFSEDDIACIRDIQDEIATIKTVASMNFLTLLI